MPLFFVNWNDESTNGRKNKQNKLINTLTIVHCNRTSIRVYLWLQRDEYNFLAMYELGRITNLIFFIFNLREKSNKSQMLKDWHVDWRSRFQTEQNPQMQWYETRSRHYFQNYFKWIITETYEICVHFFSLVKWELLKFFYFFNNKLVIFGSFMFLPHFTEVILMIYFKRLL